MKAQIEGRTVGTAAAEGGRTPPGELERLMQWLARHPDSGIDLDMLEKMQVLPSPPAWSYVRAGIEVLRSSEGKEVENRDQIEDAIVTYANILRANAEALETAVYCATVLSAFVPRERTPVMRRALEVLEESLRRGNSRDDRLRILDTIHKGLAGVFGEGDAFRKTIGSLANGRVVDWLESLNPIQSHVTPSVTERGSAYDVSGRAWEYWRKWAVQQWPNAPNVEELSVENLVCRAAEVLPGAVLRDDPMAMSIAEWTWAFRRGLHQESFHLNEIRTWFIPLALAQLGFWENARTYLTERAGDSPDLKDFIQRIRPRPKPRPPCLIVFLEPDTLAERWLPSPEVGCLACGSGDVVEVVRDLAEVSVQDIRVPFAYLLVTTKGIPTGQQQAQALVILGDLRERFPESYRYVRLVFAGDQPLARGVSLPAYYLENPPTLEEAVRHLDQLPETAWKGPPASKQSP